MKGRLTAVTALALIAAGPARVQAAVDPAVVGSWEVLVPQGGRQERFSWKIRRDGTYALQAATSGHSGTIEIAGGRWSLVAKTTTWRDQGSYQLPDADTLIASGTLGTGRWTRVKAASGGRSGGPPPGPSGSLPGAGAAGPSGAPSSGPPAGSSVAPPASSPALADYFDGLEAMRRGRFPEAAAAFSRARERQGDDPKLVLARGVALALAERFEPALEDLTRYGSLRGPGREAKLWTYAVDTMSGKSSQANAPRAPRSLQGQMPAMACEASTVAVPGHVIQGGQDYPTDYASFVLYALYKGRRANELNAAAAALRSEQCSTSTRTEDRYDGRWEITSRTCWPPSPADLERAKQLDAQAADLRQRSRVAMQRAIDATRGTYRGYLLQADAFLWSRQGPQAVQALKQAIGLEPNNSRAHEELLRLYERLGENDNATEQRIVVNRFFQTTAAPMLERAWDDIARTAWEGAAQRLARARPLDPVDARVPAYLGVTLQGAGQKSGRPAEAVAALRVALALEEARLRLDEPSGTADRILPRDIQDLGLAMWLRSRLASHLVEQGQAAQALPLYRANTTTGRFRPGWPAAQMFSALVPDPGGPQGVKPTPVNGATLVAASHMAAGRLLKTAGQPREAGREFEAAAALGPQPGGLRPRIGTGRGDTNFGGEAGAPSGEALIELAREHLELGDAARASQYLNAATQTPLSPELRRKVNELQMAIARKMSR